MAADKLPSPAQVEAKLEQLLVETKLEKDQLVWEIYHQIGNQLQIISSAINIERRRASFPECADLLSSR